jgi:hypothetical protein
VAKTKMAPANRLKRSPSRSPYETKEVKEKDTEGKVKEIMDGSEPNLTGG